MGYWAKWNSTDQVPARAIESGLISRFGAIDNTDGGDTYRYSGSVEWQRSASNTSTKVTAFGIGYNLNLFSNFTYFLDDPVHGDQFYQFDHRFIAGGKVSHQRIGHWLGHEVQNTIGVQLRNDDIPTVGLYHTEARQLLDTVRQDSVMETSAAVYAQNETQWTPWLRTLAGVRVDGYRFRVDAGDPESGGTRREGIASPKGGAVIGPFKGTEFYVNAGTGFHSNDARGTTITRDSVTGEAVDPVTPLVRAKGAEAGVRSVAVPHLQTTFTLWTLRWRRSWSLRATRGQRRRAVRVIATASSSRTTIRRGVGWVRRRRLVVECAFHRRRSRRRFHSGLGRDGRVSRCYDRQPAQRHRQRTASLLWSASVD